MEKLAQNFTGDAGRAVPRFSTIEWLGILIGIIMPVVSAVAYPTYMHSMQIAWVEWSRLLEAPFVLCEIFVILWAGRKGMDSAHIWRSMPVDIKIISGFFILGVFASSVLISEYPLRSITISVITALHILFAFAVYHLLRRYGATDFRPLLMMLGAGLVSLAALTLWRFALPPSASEVPGGVIEWASALPGFINVRHFGSWTGAITAGFLAILLYSKHERFSSAHAFYFVSAAMTIWSGTRAAVLAIAVTSVILILTRAKMPSFRSLGIIAMLTGAAMTAAWLSLPYNDASFMLFNIGDMAGSDQMTGGRLELWAATFAKWLESPVWGWGSGSQFWEVYVGWPHTQPHNAILQFLISWGVVGAFAALWLLVRAIHKVHVIAARNATLQPVLAILYALLLMSLLEGMLHYPRFIMLIMLTFAAIFALETNRQEQVAKAT